MKTRVRFSMFVTFFLSLVFSVSVFADGFPEMPNPSKTPGSLCAHSSKRRYPEGIVYCERNVDTKLKNQIIREYDEQFGYTIRQMDRQQFKIDHFIPLSIGGSNEKSNLWPQHRSVYEVTDPLEHLLSEKISQGLIKQDEAVRVIREAKTNLGRVPELIHYVESM